MGHARAIVSLAGEADQRRVAREVLSRGLSVRETEAIAKKAGASGRAADAGKAQTKDVHTRAAEEQLRLTLGTTVTIKRRGKGGAIEIAYRNEAELQRLYEFLTDSRR
jgi:ParB family chromosome partitioning protein